MSVMLNDNFPSALWLDSSCSLTHSSHDITSHVMPNIQSSTHYTGDLNHLSITLEPLLQITLLDVMMEAFALKSLFLDMIND